MASTEIESSDSDSDESAEIQSLIESYKKGELSTGGGGSEDNEKRKHDQKKKKKKIHTKTKKGGKPKKSHSHSLDYLKQRISELVKLFEEHGHFIPPAESLSEKGKVWSSRIYGADKKKQRKNTERVFLEDRIEQLEYCLTEQHGISV